MNPDDMKANEVTVEMALPPARLSNLSGSDVPVRVRASGRVVRIDRSGVAVHFGGSYRFIKKRIA